MERNEIESLVNALTISEKLLQGRTCVITSWDGPEVHIYKESDLLDISREFGTEIQVEDMGADQKWRYRNKTAVNRVIFFYLSEEPINAENNTSEQHSES